MHSKTSLDFILNRLNKHFFLFLLIFLNFQVASAEVLSLKENLKKAKNGDFIVTLQNKTATLFRIEKEENSPSISIEEISIPYSTFKELRSSFRNWFLNGALKASSRIKYEIDLNSGQLKKSYVFSSGSWTQKPLANPFLSTLLNLPLNEIPLSQRKKMGQRFGQSSMVWEPRLVTDGNIIENIHFNSYLAKWPNDKSELSGKTIEIYLPEESSLYPSYLPYWLEVSGMAGGTKIRVIDSGANLKSSLAL